MCIFILFEAFEAFVFRRHDALVISENLKIKVQFIVEQEQVEADFGKNNQRDKEIIVLNHCGRSQVNVIAIWGC